MKKLTIIVSFLGLSTFAFGQSSTNTTQGGFTSNSDMTGTHNSRFGFGTGTNITSGSSNTFIGASAGLETTTGGENTFVGGGSGKVNTTGKQNTVIGTWAGYANTTGSLNAFLGLSAGGKNTVGNGNTSIGVWAGFANTTGSDNTYVGNQAGAKNLTGSLNVFLGHKAGSKETAASNKLYIANSDTATPLIYGDFSAAALTVNGALTVTGDASKAGGGSWSVASDKRLKKDIRPFTDGLETLQKINPVHFRYNGKANMPTEKEYVGIIAQEMQEIAPYTVDTFTHKDNNGSQTKYLEYDSSALDYIMVNAIKAQQEMIAAQQKEIAGLKEMVYGLVSASKKASDAGTLHASANGEE